MWPANLGSLNLLVLIQRDPNVESRIIILVELIVHLSPTRAYWLVYEQQSDDHWLNQSLC